MNQLSSCIDFVVGIVGGNCWREPKFTFDTFDHSDEDTFDQLTNMKFNFYKINYHCSLTLCGIVGGGPSLPWLGPELLSD